MRRACSGELGCPNDAALALALADSDDPAALGQPPDAFVELGARPAAAIAARRLRELASAACRAGPALRPEPTRPG